MLHKDRFNGCLMGLAVGDALGTTVEFSSPGTFEPVTDMVGGGVFGLKAGQWTDDTSMALCLAESLVRQQGFDAADQMRRYTNWYKVGYMSSTGECFDIGGATRNALERFVRTGEPYSGSSDPMTAGNGSIMRLAPVAMAYAHQPAEAVRYAGLSSRTTHAALESVEACEALAAILVAGFRGADKAAMLSPETMKRWRTEPGMSFSPAIEEVVMGSYQRKEPPEIQGSGYVVRSLEAALWAFYKSSSFEEGALLAVNLGDDADTTGAVYGQMAGAYYGQRGIPVHWQDKLAMKEDFERLNEALWTSVTQ
ncbi:ADP-ribosylglycohydrolase family protein [Paenibacillus barcinonensis]|uniref:ADP-ribosyl-[dinitrogen reductase] hydrolase n=1 Tax=Paenibacillus barcinonensis TaxID=198119 RepID=A0A2V4VSQ9_PAEBA|nr:ADP-ribosylglycohydrolase family protein [Paenibacillus barcinonensis]PYE49790.1 ADP-ribosyl-[dinitrogen reductase] hydrolase [Paenibacillus barcinonensis]QKS56525.1 ADP-ribosylglycohydrolase family protein [Paenibacillus barcinonensis]